MRAPTRRSLLGGVAVLAAAPIVSAQPCPDAELVAIGREAVPLFHRYRELLGTFFAMDGADPDLDRVARLGDAPFDRLDELAVHAAALPASTPGGRAAKAFLLRHMMLSEFCEKMEFASDGDIVTDLAWSMVNDLLAGSAVA